MAEIVLGIGCAHAPHRPDPARAYSSGAMESGDLKYLLSYREGYDQSGSSEIKAWIAMVGALSGSYLKGCLVDYQALYRTPAGTGSSAAFMYWSL